MPGPKDIIELLNLKPLQPEGGLFAESYRSDEFIPVDSLPPRYRSDRCFATAIFYMLTSDSFSAIHRLKSDEIFHFYLGDPVTMLLLRADGSSDIIRMGHDIAKGERLQLVVPRGVWQGMLLDDGGEFALLGTTVAPGFDQTDFELGVRGELTRLYPDRREIIVRLTR